MAITRDFPSADHKFMPARTGDSRAPCPALNALANHAYLPRNGREIGFFDLVHALREVYNLSIPLAALLAIGGILLCGHGLRLDLDELALHNRIEHDGSLVHRDATPGSLTAPIPVDHGLVRDLIAYAAPNHGLSLMDFAKARFDREAHISTPLNALHSEIGSGEAALTWILMKNKDNEVSSDTLWQWYAEERIPDGWTPPKEPVGILDARGQVKNVARALKRFAEKTTPSAS